MAKEISHRLMNDISCVLDHDIYRLCKLKITGQVTVSLTKISYKLKNFISNFSEH